MNIFGYELSTLELAATIFTIVGVWLVLLKSIWNFPVGIISVILQGIVYFQSKLYSDMLLQVIYSILLVYGWLQWNKRMNAESFHAEITSPKTWIILSCIFPIVAIILGTITKFLGASLAYLDSILFSASLIAQWMIAKKKIENWIIWFVVDILYVGMYIYKHLYLFSGVYLILVIMAISGYREWKKVLVKA